MPKEPLSPIRDDPAHHAAVVCVHGFTGDGLVTWRNLADRVAADARLSSWDLWTITYGTSWLPDGPTLPFVSERLVARALRLAEDHRHRGVTQVQSPLVLCKRHPELSQSIPPRRQPPVRGRCWSMTAIAASAPIGRATGRSSPATASNTGRIRR
jgi:hypothetical protein